MELALFPSVGQASPHFCLDLFPQFAQETKQLREILIYMAVVVASEDPGWNPSAVNVPSCWVAVSSSRGPVFIQAPTDKAPLLIMASPLAPPWVRD